MNPITHMSQVETSTSTIVLVGVPLDTPNRPRTLARVHAAALAMVDPHGTAWEAASAYKGNVVALRRADGRMVEISPF